MNNNIKPLDTVRLLTDCGYIKEGSVGQVIESNSSTCRVLFTDRDGYYLGVQEVDRKFLEIAPNA